MQSNRHLNIDQQSIREDEYVFNWAHSLKEKGVPAITTVSVGQRNTEASATLTQGTTGVLSTLEKLARTI